MVYKYKVPQNLPDENLHALLEEKKIEVLNLNPNFTFVSSSVVKEAEDELQNVETLMLMFDDPD